MDKSSGDKKSANRDCPYGMSQRSRPTFPSKEWKDFSNVSEFDFAMGWLDEIDRALPSVCKGKMDGLRARLTDKDEDIDWANFYQDLAKEINELPKFIARERRRIALLHRQYLFNIKLKNNEVLMGGLPEEAVSESQLGEDRDSLYSTSSTMTAFRRDTVTDRRFSVMSYEALTREYLRVTNKAMQTNIDKDEEEYE